MIRICVESICASGSDLFQKKLDLKLFLKIA